MQGRLSLANYVNNITWYKCIGIINNPSIIKHKCEERIAGPFILQPVLREAQYIIKLRADFGQEKFHNLSEKVFEFEYKNAFVITLTT